MSSQCTLICRAAQAFVCVSDVISDVTHNNYSFYWSALTEILPWINTWTKNLRCYLNCLFPQHVYFVLFGADFSEFSVTLLNKKTRHCFSGKGLCLRDTVYWFTVQLLSSSCLILHSDISGSADTRLKEGRVFFPVQLITEVGSRRYNWVKRAPLPEWIRVMLYLLLGIKINVYFQEWREWLWLTEDFTISPFPFYL